MASQIHNFKREFVIWAGCAHATLDEKKYSHPKEVGSVKLDEVVRKAKYANSGELIEALRDLSRHKLPYVRLFAAEYLIQEDMPLALRVFTDLSKGISCVIAFRGGCALVPALFKQPFLCMVTHRAAEWVDVLHMS